MVDKPAGPAGWTSAEAQERGGRRAEIKEQKEFAKWLKFEGILFYNPRSDKKSTILSGAADFSIFFQGKTLFVEMKSLGSKQSESQVNFMNAIVASGFTYKICYSASDAIKLCRDFFCF